MKNLTARQINLLKTVNANNGKNTHQLAVARRDRQVYESYLKNRLYTLEERGLIQSVEIKSKNTVKERKWFITKKGHDYLAGLFAKSMCFGILYAGTL